MKLFITGNHAVAYGVKLCRTLLIAAYPITPQTDIYEKLYRDLLSRPCPHA